ncbi:uncharacterized protein DNG_05269 [Cephalotrichum gorgonifer]|uniref:Uncharacterized protein n=1 Tax=Cephalotrichum gorgonifer TaxID=2041049 RepID=A0AAE8SVC3_9PEZI|nr:uncharacterized protein DNG_05269 [Cephalotrichum gorgonifer]
MTRPDRTVDAYALALYQRVFLRSKGLSVPDPVASDSGIKPVDAMIEVPGPYWSPNDPPRPVPTPSPIPDSHTPPETQANNRHQPPADATTAQTPPPASPISPQSPKVVIYDAEGGLAPPCRLDEANNRPPRSFDDIRRASTSQNNVDDGENDLHLGINVIVDDAYSEASSRFRAKRSQYAASRSWRNTRGGYGSDSDKEDKGAKDGEDEAYDTDLDSQASEGGIRRPREHARKMWKWKSLVANRYEHMLLECIVNIGTSSAPNS